MRVIFISLILISNAEAAFENRALSVRAEGMGGAFTSIVDDAGAIGYNPAGSSQITLQGVTFLHHHPFNLSELEENFISFSQPTRRGGMGVSYWQFVADNNYKEGLLTTNFSTFIGKNLCIGINLKQMYLSIEEYGHKRGIGMDVGVLYQITPKINMGLAGFNLNQPLIDVEKNYNLGLSINPKENLLIAIDLGKAPRFNSEIRIGQELWMTNNLCLRAGVKKHTTTQPTLGVGILIDLIQFDYSCVFHPDLCPTHLFSLTKWF